MAGAARTETVPASPPAYEQTAEEALVDVLREERRAYALPLQLRLQAERFAHGVLELLFPHFAAEVHARAGEVAADLAALRALLSGALAIPGPHAGDVPGVVDRFFAELPAIREALWLDVQALYDGDPAAESLDEVILAYPGFFAIAIYRIAHELYGAAVPIFPRLLTEVAHRDTGIDIHPGARIGRSLAIDHGTGVTIGETAVLGARVKLYQGVTLGALSVSKRLQHVKRHPTIGDDVVIYANATILGGDTVIGKGSRIGGNVWLTRSVAPYSVVTPQARVDRSDAPRPQDDPIDFHI